jgi:hypothetical protein
LDRNCDRGHIKFVRDDHDVDVVYLCASFPEKSTLEQHDWTVSERCHGFLCFPVVLFPLLKEQMISPSALFFSKASGDAFLNIRLYRIMFIAITWQTGMSGHQ